MNTIANVPLKQNNQRYRNYQLPELLPQHCLLTCDEQLKSVILLCQDQHGFSVVTQLQIFTDVEYDLLKALIQYCPEHCSYAEMLACQSGNPFGQCQKMVNHALDNNTIQDLLRPVRNHLSRMRPKLRTFGLDIASMLGCGYVVTAAQQA